LPFSLDANEYIFIISAGLIVVPANEEGFQEVFLGQDCWYEIRISSSMIEKIKYIAG
jgi:hypothetical protein